MGAGERVHASGKENMASIYETIKSQFQPTTFLTRPEGNDMGSSTERKMEGENNGGGKREIMSGIVVVILIKWKCILSSSYWFLLGALCVFQKERLHYKAAWEYFSLMADMIIAVNKLLR